MAGNISLGSTQKAGEGDAFIYDNSGANRNIGILAQQNAQEQQQKAQADAQKKKQDYDTKKAFYDNLSSINTIGIRPQDVDFVNQRIAKILEYTNDAKMQGKNPLDMSNSTEYMKLMTDLNSLDAYASASKSLFKEDNAYINDINTNKDGMFDFGKSMEAYEERSKMPLDQAINFGLKPVLSEYNLIPQLDKVTGDNLKTLFASAKVLNDKGAVDDVNKMLGAGKQSYIQSAISLATPAINQGRITTDKVIQDATDYFDYNAKTAVYNSNKDEDQVLARVKEDNLVADRKVKNSIAQARLDVYKKNSELQQIKTNFTGDKDDPTGVTTWAYDLNEGKPEALARFNTLQLPSITLNDKGSPQVAISNKDAVLINGSNIPDNLKADIKKAGIIIDPNKQYYTMSFSQPIVNHKDTDGSETTSNRVFVEKDPTGSNIAEIVQSPLGKAYNVDVIKKVSTPYTNPEYAATKHKTSTSSTVTNKTTNSGSVKTANPTNNSIPIGTRAEWKASGWSDAQIDKGVKQGKIKLK